MSAFQRAAGLLAGQGDGLGLGLIVSEKSGGDRHAVAELSAARARVDTVTLERAAAKEMEEPVVRRLRAQAQTRGKVDDAEVLKLKCGVHRFLE
jgi:hypothetical protein